MAINIGYKQFPEFDIRKDQETVYARFVKYAERFKNNHLKAYNITDKALFSGVPNDNFFTVE